MNSSLLCEACMRSCETSQVTVFVVIFSSFCLPFDLCKQVEQILIGDCQRGCRLFDTLFIQDSIFLQFDDTIALPNCQHCKFEGISISLNLIYSIFYLSLYAACSEAYDSAIRAIKACFDGCTNAQQEYHTRSVVINNNFNFQINKRPMSPFL